MSKRLIIWDGGSDSYLQHHSYSVIWFRNNNKTNAPIIHHNTNHIMYVHKLRIQTQLIPSTEPLVYQGLAAQ
jgi:hypothetical protein